LQQDIARPSPSWAQIQLHATGDLAPARSGALPNFSRPAASISLGGKAERA
jgi:hypothetical protein